MRATAVIESVLNSAQSHQVVSKLPRASTGWTPACSAWQASSDTRRRPRLQFTFPSVSVDGLRLAPRRPSPPPPPPLCPPSPPLPWWWLLPSLDACAAASTTKTYGARVLPDRARGAGEAADHAHHRNPLLPPAGARSAPEGRATSWPASSSTSGRKSSSTEVQPTTTAASASDRCHRQLAGGDRRRVGSVKRRRTSRTMPLCSSAVAPLLTAILLALFSRPPSSRCCRRRTSVGVLRSSRTPAALFCRAGAEQPVHPQAVAHRRA